MINKSKILKKLLTTASAVAVLSGAVESASAADYVLFAGTDPSVFGTPGDFKTAANPGGIAVANGSVVFLTKAVNLTQDVVGISVSLNPYGNNGKTITVNQASTLAFNLSDTSAAATARVTAANGAAVAPGATAGARLNLTSGIVGTITITDTASLGVVTLSNVGTIVRFDKDNSVIDKNMLANAGGDGIFEVNASNVKFTADIGAAPAGNGVGGFRLLAGKSAEVKNVYLNAGYLDVNDGTLSLAAGGRITSVGTSVAGGNKGTVSFLGAFNVDNIIGEGNSLSVANFGSKDSAGGKVILGGADAKATTLNFFGNKAELNFKAGVAGKVAGNVVANEDGDGKITTDKGDLGITGNVGTADQKLGLVSATGGGVTFTANAGKDLSVNVKDTNAPAGNKVSFVTDAGTKTVTINTNISTTVGGTGKVTSVDFTAGGANDVVATLAAGSKVYATTVDLGANAAANGGHTLILQDGALVSGTVSGANKGTLQVAGDSTVEQISTNAAQIKLVEFTKAGKTLTVNAADANANATSVLFTTDGTYAYAGKGNINFGTVSVATTNTGAITLNNLGANTANFTALVGTDKTKVLKSLEASGGGTVSFKESAFIQSVVGSNDAVTTFDLNNAAGTYLIGSVAGSKSVLQVSEDVTLVEGSLSKDGVFDKISFAVDKTLTVENGVNLSATSGIDAATAAANNTGTLLFKGSSDVSGVVGATKGVKAITVAPTAANGVVRFLNSVSAQSGTVDANGTLRFSADVTVGNLDGAAAGNAGALAFDGVADVTTVKSTIGSTTKFKSVEIAGSSGKFIFDGTEFKTDALKLTSAKDVIIDLSKVTTLAAGDIGTITTTTNGNIIKLPSVAALSFAGVVGEAGKSVGTLELNSSTTESTYTVANKSFYIDLVTDTNNKNSVIFNIANTAAQKVGTAEIQFNNVTFNATGVSVSDVYAKNVTVAAGQTVNLSGTLGSNGGGTKLGNGASMVFSQGASLESALDGVTNNNGTVTFNDGLVITNAIGSKASLAQVNFNSTANADASAFLLGADVSASNIAINNIVDLDRDVKLTGAVNFNPGNDGGVDLDGHKLTVVGNPTITKVLNLAVTTSVTNGNLTGGSLVVDGAPGGVANKLTLTNASLGTIYVDDQTGVLPATTRSYKLIDVANGAVIDISAADLAALNGKEVVKSKSNLFSRWNLAVDQQNGNVVSLVQTNDAVSAMTRYLARVGGSSADAAALGSGGDANLLALQSDLSMVDETKIVESLERLTKSNVTTTAIAANINDNYSNLVTERLVSVSPTAINVSDSGSGVAAGDNDSMFGAWVAPFFNQTTKKKANDAAAYKSDTAGGMVGVDTLANPDMLLGASVGFGRTSVKYKGFKSGDKATLNTVAFSIYSMQQITNEWFAQTVVSYNSSKVKSKERRLTSGGYQIATGSFETTAFGADLMAGYKQKFEGATLTPMFGVNFTRVNDGSYKETGTTNQNLSITKKTINKFEVVGGARVQMDSLPMNDIALTPEVHGFVKYDVMGKKPTVNATLGTAKFTAKTDKPERVTYNVGLSVNGTSGMYEYGLGYDYVGASKLMSHQGTLKLRVNF